MPIVDRTPLRRCVLAVSVLSDLDVLPSDDGVLLPGPGGVVVVGWSAIEDAVGDLPPEGPTARRRVGNLLNLHRVAAGFGPDAVDRFLSASRAVALPPGHAEHPGTGWVRDTLRGNALDLGIGVLGLLDEPDRTVPLPESVLRALGIDASAWWPRLRDHAERMGALSAARLKRDGPSGVIRPVGGCDVLTLLSSRILRRHMCDSDGTGLRALAVPTRRRGWFDVSQVDPAFVRAAWSLTDEHERGLPVPLLVTTDEITLPFSLA